MAAVSAAPLLSEPDRYARLAGLVVAASHRRDGVGAAPAQAATAVSLQSRPLHDESALHQQVHAVVAAGDSPARPPAWTSYRLVPQEIEFWYGSTDACNPDNQRLLVENSGQLPRRRAATCTDSVHDPW